eukprot:XP_017946403.1 PREDICTED: uncharacterized protein LOC105946358 [Xenopus tropicalis]
MEVTLEEMRTIKSDNEIKQMAFESLKARAAVLTAYAFPENDEQALRNILCSITHPEDVNISRDVEAFAGKTEIYLGKGENASEERLALQKLLQEFTLQNEATSDLMSKKIAAVKSIVVYVPSKLLHSGIEMVELPGTDHSDPLVFSFIQDALDTADALLLLSEFAFVVTGKEVKYMLKHSGFFKNWLKDSQEYKLMFLSYPEKNSLTPNMTRNIVTSTILPLLHTSIHAQEGMPHELIGEYARFLQYTGIQNLLTQLDLFILKRKQILLEELENKLTDFEKKKSNESNKGPRNSAGCSPQKPDIIQESFLKKNEDLFNGLKQTQERIINDTINSTLTDLMLQSATSAIKMWAEKERKITDPGIFNPEYKGKHPAFQKSLHYGWGLETGKG